MAVFPTITVDRSSINISDMIAVLEGDDRVVFAYLYGSFLEEGPFRDVDIAVFTSPDENPFEVSADLKIALSRRTGIPPDCFDIRVINQVVDTCDLTGLLYLEDVLPKADVLWTRIGRSSPIIWNASGGGTVSASASSRSFCHKNRTIDAFRHFFPRSVRRAAN